MEGETDRPVPPSARAAVADVHRLPRHRAYPLPLQPEDHQALVVQLAATRALLTATSPREVIDVVATFVRDLGGTLVPARADAEGALPIDVSLGVTEPILPWADPVSVAAMRLAELLPEFVEDARAVCARLHAERRNVLEADRDALTGLMTRRAWMRRLGAAPPGAVIALVDLDRFKQVNDTAGHAVGDTILRAFASVLTDCFRDLDDWGRYGGDEMAGLVTSMSAEELLQRLSVVRSRWEAQRPQAGASVGMSAGVAGVRAADPLLALRAADVALYRAKGEGRNRTCLASAADYPTG